MRDHPNEAVLSRVFVSDLVYDVEAGFTRTCSRYRTEETCSFLDDGNCVGQSVEKVRVCIDTCGGLFRIGAKDLIVLCANAGEDGRIY